ncbi:MAG: serine protease [Patescibacteria group bacterium]
MADSEAADFRRPSRRRVFLLTIFVFLLVTVAGAILIADLEPAKVIVGEPERPNVEVDPSLERLATEPPAIAMVAGQTVIVNHDGSGVVLRKGVVITAGHVVDYHENDPDDKDDTVSVFCDGKEVQGKTVKSTMLYDIAVIKVKCDGKTLALDTGRIPADEQLRLTGFSFALKREDGRVSGRITRFVRGASLIPDGHLTAKVDPMVTSIIPLEDEMRRLLKIPRLRALAPLVNPGNSGSPVIRMDGGIVGIAVIAQNSHGRSFMVPAINIRTVLKAAGVSENDD